MGTCDGIVKFKPDTDPTACQNAFDDKRCDKKCVKMADKAVAKELKIKNKKEAMKKKKDEAKKKKDAAKAEAKKKRDEAKKQKQAEKEEAKKNKPPKKDKGDKGKPDKDGEKGPDKEGEKPDWCAKAEDKDACEAKMQECKDAKEACLSLDKTKEEIGACIKASEACKPKKPDQDGEKPDKEGEKPDKDGAKPAWCAKAEDQDACEAKME